MASHDLQEVQDVSGKKEKVGQAWREHAEQGETLRHSLVLFSRCAVGVLEVYPLLCPCLLALGLPMHLGLQSTLVTTTLWRVSHRKEQSAVLRLVLRFLFHQSFS